MQVAFGAMNYSVLCAYLIAMLAIGFAFARRQRSGTDFFLAGRRMPWLPVAMSMYASLTSATTFMGLPGKAYAENLSLLIVCLVSPLLVPLLVLVLYPRYRALGVTTSYEFIGQRYGPGSRYAVALLFILTRLSWLGIVVYGPALALSIATGMEIATSILIIGVLATAYTVMGGMSAVIWTDVAQFIILVTGAIWVMTSLIAATPDGTAGILRAAAEADHLHVLSMKLSLTKMSGLAVAITFFLQLLQEYGFDQVGVQRMLTVRTNRGVTQAAIFNACTDVLMIGLLSFIGLGLFIFYLQHPDPRVADLRADAVLPFYIVTRLPAGVAGLIISAIFAAAMSSMDSGINSLATVVENDLVGPRRRSTTARAEVRQARLLSLLFGIIAIGIATLIHLTPRIESIVDAFAMSMSLFSAPVLALFLLGFFTRRARFSAWLAALPFGIGFTLLLQFSEQTLVWLRLADPAAPIKIHWVYYFPSAFAVTTALTWIFSLKNPTPPAPDDRSS